MKAGAGKPHTPFERRTVASAQARHLRPDTGEGAQQNALEGRGPALIEPGCGGKCEGMPRSTGFSSAMICFTSFPLCRESVNSRTRSRSFFVAFGLGQVIGL